MVQIVCFRCGEKGERASRGKFRMCLPCSNDHGKETVKAVAIVNRAVATGKLPRVDTLKCVDCGAQAYDYDHHDYAQPLVVQPTCRSCNLRRGPSLSSKTPSLPNRPAKKKAEA